jgi:hypothetical protein
MPKTVKASELKLRTSEIAKVRAMMAPLEAWEAISDPDIYLENRSGKYVRGLEMLLEKAIELNNLDMVRGLTLDLLRLTKLGRSKAEVSLMGGSKLRDEVNFRDMTPEQIKAVMNSVEEK